MDAPKQNQAVGIPSIDGVKFIVEPCPDCKGTGVCNCADCEGCCRVCCGTGVFGYEDPDAAVIETGVQDEC